MLFLYLEPAETSMTPTIPPMDLASVTNDGGEGKTCLDEQTSQDLSILQPPMETLLETWLLRFLLDFRVRKVSQPFYAVLIPNFFQQIVKKLAFWKISWYKVVFQHAATKKMVNGTMLQLPTSQMFFDNEK